jgi:hypothetical protein
MQILAKTLPEYSVVRAMSCIGDTLAPRLIAEIGDVHRFTNKHSLIAYAGIDAPPLGTNANSCQFFFVGETFAFSFKLE